MTLNSSEARESLAPRLREDQAAGGGRSVVFSLPHQPDGVQPADGSRPGRVAAPADVRAKWQSERARRAIVLDSVRAHLDEQPSPRAIRSCARRWADEVIRLADDVIEARQKQGHE